MYKSEAIALEATLTLRNKFGRGECRILADRYHMGDEIVKRAAETYSPEQFLRLFITAHGMQPVGLWQTHTYARLTDSLSGKDHFFLIPMPFQRRKQGAQSSGASPLTKMPSPRAHRTALRECTRGYG